MITAERLREVLRYDRDTGKFYWRVKTCRKVVPGAEAGHTDRKGYVCIRIDGEIHRAHHLAWLYEHGEWPALQVDHKNRRTGDNRAANLRLATDMQNRANCKRYKNNSSGFKGVTWCSKVKKWKAFVTAGRKKHYCGAFDDPAVASRAYMAKASVIFGDFATPGQ